MSYRTWGLILLIAALALPAMAYEGGQYYNAIIAGYGGPPNQGAMLTAYLIFLASAAFGCFLGGAGLVLTIISFRKSPPPTP